MRKAKRGPQIALPLDARAECARVLAQDAEQMREGGVRISVGDLRCLLTGHLARLTIQTLAGQWDTALPLAQRMNLARQWLGQLVAVVDIDEMVTREHAA